SYFCAASSLPTGNLSLQISSFLSLCQPYNRLSPVQDAKYWEFIALCYLCFPLDVSFNNVLNLSNSFSLFPNLIISLDERPVQFHRRFANKHLHIFLFGLYLCIKFPYGPFKGSNTPFGPVKFAFRLLQLLFRYFP